ncbi:MAG: YidC/Oxa1 family membrane protein insertase [Saccharofermentans sp.]|nr:YidC/Oxa1 family membrane protein insertase [Saccharofermentans sp.]
MGEILLSILIRPLELVFEFIFSLSHSVFPNPAVNIIMMSLAINFLVLPLYRRADVIQAASRKKEEQIRPVVDHIKKYFKSDERVLVLQAYYREVHYSPLSSLKSIVSLLLQIPFFMAAYRFLSNLSLLNGESIGPIKDLSEPDALIVIGGLSINLLPILMTLINIVSSEVYMRGQPFKSKVVLYLSAAIFLVLLYGSPSGLVFYWTLNNLFSLFKNIVYKILDSRPSKAKKQQPQLKKSEQLLFWISALFIAAFAGILIPSSVVSSSPMDFIFLNDVQNPSHYVWHTLAIAFGFFVVWIGVYFLLGSARTRKIFGMVMFALAGTSAFNYFVYGSGLGTITTELVFDFDISLDTGLMLITTLSSLVVFAVLFILSRYLNTVSRYIIAAGLLAVFGMGITNMISINRVYADSGITENAPTEGSFTLSRTGKNVMVIMIDRAIGSYIPFFFNEDSDLVRQFDGFTYYPNTISFGQYTNFGAPALFGGYEYTPEKINSRADELLMDKHNEALLVMPVLFSNEGYNVTVMDPPYANYREVPDTSIYDGYSGIDSFVAEPVLNGHYSEMNGFLEEARYHNFFAYSMLKTAPTALQGVIYNGGSYNYLTSNGITAEEGVFHFPQSYGSVSVTDGINPDFYNAYKVLDNLSEIMEITDDDVNNLLVIDNNTAHSPNILQTPDYTLSDSVDNTEYDLANAGRMLPDGRTITVDAYVQMAHYHANMAAIKTLGKWFDRLRENGVWYNTRIIIVADHGRSLFQDSRLIFDDLMVDAESVNPLLMVKDFNSTGFVTSDEFMTNADVPTIATEGLINDPVNPFTGAAINNDDKFSGPQHIIMSDHWRVQENDGNTFLPGSWYSVHDSIFDRDNWDYLGEY